MKKQIDVDKGTTTRRLDAQWAAGCYRAAKMVATPERKVPTHSKAQLTRPWNGNYFYPLKIPALWKAFPVSFYRLSVQKLDGDFSPLGIV